MTISLIICATASGDLLPPYVVYKSVQLYSSWCQGGPPNCRYGNSPSGWFDGTVFREWVEVISMLEKSHAKLICLLKCTDWPRAVSNRNVESVAELLGSRALIGIIDKYIPGEDFDVFIERLGNFFRMNGIRQDTLKSQLFQEKLTSDAYKVLKSAVQPPTVNE
uniref:DDE-1 domain-containing protein n=1 Tax=Lutzomyia longipalpis TaxID=7200 RepID=A0A1B0CCW4_LUTLO